MKNNILYKSILFLAVAFGLASCEDRDIVTVENSATPIVMDLSADKLILDGNFPDNPALTVSWDLATYTVPVQIYYNVEVSATNDFEVKENLGTATGGEKAASFTTAQMNSAAIALGFSPGVESKMYMRISSYLGNNSLEAVSNVTSIDITPYVLVYPDFYLVGNASYVGWTDTKAQLLSKNANLAIIYTYMEQNNSFRFLGQQAWNPINYSIDAPGINDEYKYFKSVSPNVEADGAENMKFTGETGMYKITIDATKGSESLKIEKSPVFEFDVAQVYLVGSIAGNNWSEGSAIAMTKVDTGVFEYTTTIDDGTEFKFLGQQSWGSLDWGNLTENGNSGYLGPKGDNGNIKFDGGGSNYKITVNVKAGTYQIVKL